MTTRTAEQVLTHAWTEAGHGQAPFKCVGFYAIPSKSLAEQNPSAYALALQAMPRGYGIGSCQVCGMPLTNNFLIHSADGKKFAVGCDCVGKTDDTKLVDKVELLRKRANREKARARAAAKREAQRLAALAELEAQRTRNGGLTDYEVEQKMIRDQEAAKTAQIRETLADVFVILDDKTSDFWISVRQDLERGRAPVGRGMVILLNELAKNGIDPDAAEALIEEVQA